MNYKRLLKSREMRMRILRLLSFIPDKTMLKLQYRIKTGRKLDLKDPKRLTEKQQWYKLYHKDPIMIPCVDKYDVRGYVESKGLGHTLVKCYGVYDRAEDVDFSVLPQRFVLKDTLGTGGNSVIIVTDKATMDISAVTERMNQWVNLPHRIRDGGREWPYYHGKKHRITAEEFIEAEDPDLGLVDYKTFCFNGRMEYIYAMCDRKPGETVKVGIYDRDFNKLPVLSLGHEDTKDRIAKPENYDELVSVAEKLSEDFPHARVDLYDNDGKIYFGEITFYGGSGYDIYEPDEFDFEIGAKFVLPEIPVSPKG